jgi:hypothetical protein
MSGPVSTICRVITRCEIHYLSRIAKLLSLCQPKYWIRSRRPRVVFMTGMPRSGTTLAKRYLGEHPDLAIAPAGKYQDGWAFAMEAPKDKIVVFKNTRNMPILPEIYTAYGNRAWFFCLVRDPRDELASLFETDIHPEVPRNEMFWPLWKERYLSFFDFCRRYGQKNIGIALLRYEDLVLNPSRTKAAFLNWLGLPLAKLDPCYRTIPEIALGPRRGEDWKTHQYGKIHAASLGRWCHETKTDRLRTMSHYKLCDGVIELMHMFGYTEEITDPTIKIQGLSLM